MLKTYKYLASRFGLDEKRPYSPQVLLVKEKHGDMMLDASTPEALCRSCIALLSMRLNSTYKSTGKSIWYPDDDTLTEEDKQGSFFRRGEVLSAAEEARRILAIQTDTPEGLMMAGQNAYIFLDGRSDYEYEEIELESVRQPENLEPYSF